MPVDVLFEGDPEHGQDRIRAAFPLPQDETLWEVSGLAVLIGPSSDAGGHTMQETAVIGAGRGPDAQRKITGRRQKHGTLRRGQGPVAFLREAKTSHDGLAREQRFGDQGPQCFSILRQISC